MNDDVPLLNIGALDFAGIAAAAKDRKIGLVVFGPEAPLIEGGANFLREEGLNVFGPDQSAARLEGSKAYSKRIMTEAGVPTAAYESFTDPDEAKRYARIRTADGFQVVVKASGNAVGKGVTVCDDIAQAEEAIQRIMVDRAFGSAGSEIVIEDRMSGREFSLFTLVSDRSMLSLPIARDYKRVGDSDNGPNTGGMGSYSPDPTITDSTIWEVEDSIVKPVLAALNREGMNYRGVLFTGVMMHGGRPHCLEFNVRFGDPETQSLMATVAGGLAEGLLASSSGGDIPTVRMQSHSAVTVVLASQGYPGNFQTGYPIHIGDLPDQTKVFHAGTKEDSEKWITAGGRVLSVTSWDSTVVSARERAYEAIRSIRFEGMMFRKDIAAGIEQQ
jgi:phosphoribosylamine--glycine ligase